MAPSFLESYRDAFGRIEGWFSLDAALMYMAYAGLAASNGVSGNVLEIGVFHGLSAIAIASLRGHGATFVAVDLFDAHDVPASHFHHNMKAFFDDTEFVRSVATSSNALSANDLGRDFSFCHVDGGHSAAETYGDLDLCASVLNPGGLLALDDYFNPSYPGVAEGAIKFWLAHPTLLQPIALGFNKVLFQKQPASFNLKEEFDSAFPFIPHSTATLWDTPIHMFAAFRQFVDLARSHPLHLTPFANFRLDAELTPQTSRLSATQGAQVRVPIRVVNHSSIPFDTASQDTRFGLSYHLLSSHGHTLQFDNRRNYFSPPLAPGENRLVDMVVDTPDTLGDYEIEVDIVWEGITWLKQRGVDTPRIALTVV